MGRGEFLGAHLKGEAPPQEDGRHVDPRLGVLGGEGALQRVEHLGEEGPHSVAPQRESTSDRDTYYGLAVLKEPVWKAAVPAYFYVGGVAGAAAALGAAAQWSGGPIYRRLCETTRAIAAGGAVLGSALLIEDLGRPSRFLNMLRVFRPTSPMNMGSWILAGFGGCAALAAMLRKARSGPLAAIGDAAAMGAGVLGVPLAGYTGVLLANTAVPVWQGARTALPPLFMASAVTSAACALDLIELNRIERRAVRRFGIAGKAAELVLSKALEKEVAASGRAALPLQQGTSGALWKGAKLLVAASLALSLLPAAPRRLRRASGWLGTIGSLALRFGISYAGTVSSRDPRATFEQQGAGLVAREGRGASPELEPSGGAQPAAAAVRST